VTVPSWPDRTGSRDRVVEDGLAVGHMRQRQTDRDKRRWEPHVDDVQSSASSSGLVCRPGQSLLAPGGAVESHDDGAQQ
jgi:hypothetical protein